MGTRTYTVYFDADALADLNAAIADLRESLRSRAPHVLPQAATAMNERLLLLEGAARLLLEPVPPSFGG